MKPYLIALLAATGGGAAGFGYHLLMKSIESP
jgi:hypothetical protein